MGLNHSPRIVTDGLVLCLDVANQNKCAKGFKNLLNLSTWTLGTGSVTGFNQNGTTAENQRILDTGPFGVSTVVWDTPSNDATSDGDGGWDGTSISIDATKMYRFSVWIRRKIIGNGSYYLGCAGGVLNRSNGVLNNNPYFSAAGWPGSILANQWMLVVGHVWPAGSGTGANHVDSGLWNTSGTRFSGPTSSGDFVWQTSSTTTNLRSYLYYSTDTTTNQQWYQPRIDLVDGTEPTIAELISGVGSKLYNLVGNNQGTILNSASLYNSAGYMTFDGVDDSIDITDAAIGNFGTNNFTISCWGKATSGSTGTRGILSKYNPHSGNGTGWFIFFRDGNVWVRITQDLVAPLEQSSISVSVTTNQWHNIVIRRNTNNFSLFVDGNLVQNNTTTNIIDCSSTAPLRIGSGYSSGYYYDGIYSNCLIYNRSLSDDEIRQNFNANKGRFGI